MSKIRVGTRPSELAVTQAESVVRRLESETSLEPELVEIESEGDRKADQRFEDFDGTGFFSSALELALLDGEVDAAVHSLKDLTTEQPEKLTVAAIPERSDHRDAFVVPMSAIEDMMIDPLYPLANLPEGLHVGTSSVRRRAQAKWLGSEARFRDVRGNIPSRLDKLRDKGLTGLLLANAGLKRLGLDLEDPGGDLYAIPFEVEHFVPAPGQGALAVEVVRGSEFEEEVRKIDVPEVREAVELEREVLHRLQGGCSVPVGAYAERLDSGEWQLDIFAGKFRDMIPETVRERLTGESVEALVDEAMELITGGLREV